MFEESITSYFNCIGSGCTFGASGVNSKSVLWTQTLHPPLHWHGGEYILNEVSFFFGELSLKPEAHVDASSVM